MMSLKNAGFDTNRTLDWPKQLLTPAELVEAVRHRTRLGIIRSPLCSKIILQIVGSWAYLVANVFNKSRLHNYEVFSRELQRIESQVYERIRLADGDSEQQQQQSHDSTKKKAPLITYSNHISCIDDPVLWGTLLPFSYYSTRSDSVRWSAAAIDICFSRPWHSTFFSLGKTFPIIRGIGLEQPAMEFACALLKRNLWLHLFPEGRVMRDANQQKLSNLHRGYIFKWGIAKLLLDYFKNPPNSDSEIRLLPFYHLGMDEILPIGWPYVPRSNKQITVLLRPNVIEMNQKLLDDIIATRDISNSKSMSDDEIKRVKVTNYLEEEMEQLAELATELHKSDGGQV